MTSILTDPVLPMGDSVAFPAHVGPDTSIRLVTLTAT